MGQQSRRDKPAARAAKDPLRYQRANVEAKAKRMAQMAELYHIARAEHDRHAALLAQKEKALAAAEGTAEVTSEAPGGMLMTQEEFDAAQAELNPQEAPAGSSTESEGPAGDL